MTSEERWNGDKPSTKITIRGYVVMTATAFAIGVFLPENIWPFLVKV